MNQDFSSPLEEKGRSFRIADPCVLIIFGATGDLSARRLFPAIYNLGIEGNLPSNFACIAFARKEKTIDQFRLEMKQAIQKHSRLQPIDEVFWNNFQKQIHYHKASFDQGQGYDSLKQFLEQLDAQIGTKGNRIYYLATPPKHFPQIIEKLSKHNLIYDEKKDSRFSRVIIEKPFGNDFTSAKKLQTHILQYLSENQIYRIDHWLGKETVQNLLVLRFANSIFESLWNKEHIDHVQITVAEELGVGTRGRFFEEQGMLRDIVQNHVMQLLSLVAMEPPKTLSPNEIRDNKVKLLQSIQSLNPQDYCNTLSRGQYGKGYIHGEKVLSYREEEDVSPSSSTETYVALKLFIDNARWKGVPFYLRAAKRMPKRITEIAIVFKDAPKLFFSKENEPNVLALRIQPNEGISLKMNCKVPGQIATMQPVQMNFQYGSYFGKAPPEAYERLIFDCMLGDNTLFTRSDEVLTSWKLLTPLIEHWKKNPAKDFPNYAAGSWGPKCSDEMVAKDHHTWRLL